MSDFETRTFGDVTCIKGDCLDVMPTLNPKIADAMFADLPFGELKRMQWDTRIDIQSFWALADKVTSGALLLMASMRFASVLIASNVKEFKYDLVFEKPLCSNPLLAKKRPLYVHEHILVFGRTPKYTPQMREASLRTDARTHYGYDPSGKKNSFFGHTHTRDTQKKGALYPRSVLTGLGESRQHNIHPTQKPVALLEWLIATYTNPGDLILDPTAGSGTCGVAALNLGRRAILVEKDPDYFEVMCKRIAEHQTNLATNV